MRADADLDDPLLAGALQKAADLGTGHAEALRQLLLRHLVGVVERGDLGHRVEFRVADLVGARRGGPGSAVGIRHHA
jgi:hypothetical protein